MNGTSWARTSSAAREPRKPPVGSNPNPGSKKPGVVRPQLAAGRVVGRHFGRQVGRDAHRLVGHQEIEALRRQHQAVAVLPEDGVPERHRVDLRPRRQVEQRRAVAGAVPDLPPLVPPQVEPEEEPVGEDEVVDGHRRARLVEDRLLQVGLADLVVAEPRTARWRGGAGSGSGPPGPGRRRRAGRPPGREGRGTPARPRRSGRCCP